MTNTKDKDVIEGWLRLYNCELGTSFQVVDWPDLRNPTKKEIDAVCEDPSGNWLAIEHTRIEAFKGEKEDGSRFLQTLAGLENDPDLVQPGYEIDAVQAVGAIPNGVDWKQIQKEQREQLKVLLPALPAGIHKVVIHGKNWNVVLKIDKELAAPGKVIGGFRTARTWPGDPGAELIFKAFADKIPKLAMYSNARTILLLEKDAVAGTIESQFAELPETQETRDWLQQIDEVWSVNTMCMPAEPIIFTNQVWPGVREHVCSLNVDTGVFRRWDH